ncbi:MAG: hypothetical protein ACXADW_22460 [Candidatus Hodarchaeales archaeon]
MPEELKSIEEFMTTLDLASVCYVKRLKKSDEQRRDCILLKQLQKKQIRLFKV